MRPGKEEGGGVTGGTVESTTRAFSLTRPYRWVMLDAVCSQTRRAPNSSTSRPTAGWVTNGTSGTASRSPETATSPHVPRSEEHTSELQSQSNLVCRLLLE